MAARVPVSARARKRSTVVVRSRGVRDGVSSRGRVVEIQRARLLGGALDAIEELGYPRVTVAHVASRARVSRRTFYELFENREDCLLGALESVVGMIRDELERVGLDRLSWRERVRTGLWVILSFFDREPVLARACVVQALRGGPRVLERREEVLAKLARAIDEGRGEGARGNDCPQLTAEGLVGAVFTVVYGRLLRNDCEPLTGLHGELMRMLVLPYLGPAAARREQERPVPSSDSAERGGHFQVRPTREVALRPVENVLPAMRLTYRTVLVLEAIAQHPGVSNRLAAQLSDISDQGQISKLLARLKRLGLVENTGDGHAKGEANAWALTEAGCRVAQSIRAHTDGYVEC